MKRVLFAALLAFSQIAFSSDLIKEPVIIGGIFSGTQIVGGTISGTSISGGSVPASSITGTVAIANGGTNATSYTAPSGTINPIIFWDGTRFNTDVLALGLGYDPVSDIFYTPTLKISNALTTTATFTNTGAQSPTGGSGMIGYSDPGAAILSGNRLGFYLSGGSIDTAHTLVNPVGWGGYASENYTSIAQGSNFQIQTTPIGSTAAAGRRTVATFGADGSQTNIGTISGTQLTSTVATGTVPLVVTSTTPVTNLSIGGNSATSTTATNLAGGSGGTIPYQSAAGTTAMLANGTAGQMLQANGTTVAPSWTSTIAPTSINGVTTDSTTNKPVTAASLAGGTLPVAGTTGQFSNGVTNNGAAATTTRHFFGTGTTTGAGYADISNTSGAILFGVEGSAGGWGIVGDSAYDAFIVGTNLAFSANQGSNLHMKLSATGLVINGNLSASTGYSIPLLITTGAVANQIRTAQTTAPTCTTNCGTGGAVIGTDTAGKVTIGATGTPASGVLITFNGTWAAAPACTAVATKAGMTAFVQIAVATTTTLTLDTAAAPANSDTYSYNCIGVQ